MPTNTDSDEKLKWSFSEKWGFFILGVGVILLFIYIGMWLLGEKPSPESHHIHIYFTEDTINTSSPIIKDLYSHTEVDSLISIIQNHEALLELKYQYILDHKEEEDRFKTYLVIIVSIILSIAAFFGFKTISDLKKQCREEASTIASNVSNEKATVIAEQKADEVAKVKAEQVAEAKAVSIAEAKAAIVAETKATTIAEAKATLIAEAKAKEVAEAKATEVAEAKAAEVAKTKATEVAEAKASEVAEARAYSVAVEKAKEVAEEKAIEAASGKANDISNAVASKVGEEIAKSVTTEYLKLNFKKAISEQFDNIQENEVYQQIKKDNETFIKLEIEKLRTYIIEQSHEGTDDSGINQDLVDPADLNFD